MPTLLTPAQMKPKSFDSRRYSFFLFLFSFTPRADAPHVYMRASTLSCFRPQSYYYVSTQTFRRALTESLDSCAETKECPFSGVTSCGRVRRTVLESDARSVGLGYDSPSI